MKKKSLFWSVLALCLSLILGFFLLPIFVSKNYPITPYGMMLRDGCDPIHTYYRQTISMEDYYIPWAAYNQVRVTPFARYADQAFLGFNYPDLSYIVKNGKTPEEKRRKITIKIDDRKKVATVKSLITNDIKLFNLKEQPKKYFGFRVFEAPSFSDIYYLDTDKGKDSSYITCSKNNDGCMMDFEDGRLSYRVWILKHMFPDARNLKENILKKVSVYKTIPDKGIVLPEAYGNMMGRYKCHN